MAETSVSQIASAVQEIQFRALGTAPAVLSTEVARHFQKKHSHILRDIDRMLSIYPESFRESNFGRTFLEIPGPNGAIRKERAYLLTKDAVALLVFGFTGRAAAQWKLRYIEAFNAMEAELRRMAGLEAGAARYDRRRAAREGAEAVLALPPFQREVLARLRRYAGMGLSCAELARLLGCGETSVKRSLRTARALGLAPQPPVQGSLLETAEEGGRHV